MSSRREVLIRILALLQRKTLIETKNRTLKCLKWHYLTLRSMKKRCSVDGGRGICPLFRPHLRGFDSSRVPIPRNLPSKAKKMLMPGVQPGGGGGGAGRRWNSLMHNTNWIVDPFTQVKSAKYMVKPKTKSISNLGAFSNCSKTERSIYNFLKIPA